MHSVMRAASQCACWQCTLQDHGPRHRLHRRQRGWCSRHQQQRQSTVIAAKPGTCEDTRSSKYGSCSCGDQPCSEPKSKKKTIKNVIGSAHNNKEIYMKLKQGCKQIVFSRLFETSYKDKKGHVGIIKFNLLNNYSQCLVPLAGIKRHNLLKLNLITARSFAILSEIKKKPAKIISRLF